MAHGKHTVSCESEGRDQYEYEQAKAQSCQVPEGFGRTCGEPEAKACETCKELVCDQHGLYYEGVWYCFPHCSEAMDLDDSATELLQREDEERQREEYETIGMRPDGSFPAGHFAARRAAEKDRYFGQHDTREEARA